mgnify:CR=1 FL=1
MKRIRSFCNVLAIFTPCAWCIADGPILVPQVKNKMGRGDRISVRVDRNEDYYGRKNKKDAPKFESVKGSIVTPRDKFGYVRISKGRGKDTYISLLRDSSVLYDRVIEQDLLDENDFLVVFGDLRGYVAGLGNGTPRRRIAGAQLVFRLTNPLEAAKAEGKKPRSPKAITGRLISKEPLVLKAIDGKHYEIRPSNRCRFFCPEKTGPAELKKGMKVQAEGYREKIILRPKGRTVMKIVFQTRLLRILSPEIKESEYWDIFKHPLLK